MPKYRYNLGIVGTIKAEALGIPGQRTFRLLAEATRGKATLWVEKEQLLQLALALQGLLEGTYSPSIEAEDDASTTIDARSFEFQVGRLTLSYDAPRGLFLLLIHDIESAEGAIADLSLHISRHQAQGLYREALRVCAAGRPLCSLCGLPIGPDPHRCVRSNGHTSQRL